MWMWSVAFDGWATALVTGVLFTAVITVALRKSERHRAVTVAMRTAQFDFARNVNWLSYVTWQRWNPEKAPRDHQFGSFDLFPHYAPVLMAERPELAGYLLSFNAWVQYLHHDIPEGYGLADDDTITIVQTARTLRDGFGFKWPDDDVFERFGVRDYSVR